MRRRIVLRAAIVMVLASGTAAGLIVLGPSRPARHVDVRDQAPVTDATGTTDHVRASTASVAATVVAARGTTSPTAGSHPSTTTGPSYPVTIVVKNHVIRYWGPISGPYAIPGSGLYLDVPPSGAEPKESWEQAVCGGVCLPPDPISLQPSTEDVFLAVGTSVNIDTLEPMGPDLDHTLVYVIATFGDCNGSGGGSRRGVTPGPATTATSGPPTSTSTTTAVPAPGPTPTLTVPPLPTIPRPRPTQTHAGSPSTSTTGPPTGSGSASATTLGGTQPTTVTTSPPDGSCFVFGFVNATTGAWSRGVWGSSSLPPHRG